MTPPEPMAVERCAIIPARGGSKGIFRKNLVALAGRPLLSYAVAAANAARFVDAVYVSTDDDEIADVARTWGARVVRRPEALSDDNASSEAALLHALDAIRDENDVDPTLCVFLQCTAPLMTSVDIDGTARLVADGGFDSAFAAVPFHYFVWRRDEERSAVGVNHDSAKRLLRQERVPEYLEAGAVYAMDVTGFRRNEHRFFGRVGIYEMPASRCVEIDDWDDLRVASALMGDNAQLRARLSTLPKPRMLVLDFDGVFTDNRVLVMQDGTEAVFCSRGDGMGISNLKSRGIEVVVLSTESNPVVVARSKKLGLECYHDVSDKLAALTELVTARSISMSEIVYVGNDQNDTGCLRAAGCGIAVADGHPSARAAADIVVAQTGGSGAIRAICDALEERLGG